MLLDNMAFCEYAFIKLRFISKDLDFSEINSKVVPSPHSANDKSSNYH